MLDELFRAAKTYAFLRDIYRLRPDGAGGCLFLAAWPADQDAASRSGTTLPVRAANIAGAGSLVPVEDTARGRGLVQEGVCDFLVTGLDEALRILKNELRRRQPVSVAVLVSTASLLAECIERGVQPDLMASAVPVLEHRGACVVGSVREAASDSAADERMVAWILEPPVRGQFPAIDALALASLEDHDLVLRKRWIARAPQYLSRTLRGAHTLPMLPGELARFQALLAANNHAPELTVVRGSDTAAVP